MRRILVTGSRDWTDRDLVGDVLEGYRNAYVGPDFIVVHGACPTGADLFADTWCGLNRVNVERHPAWWHRYGNAAGPIRNQEMVDLGAFVTLAFAKVCTKPRCEVPTPHGSHGTLDCALAAQKARIPVMVYREGW